MRITKLLLICMCCVMVVPTVWAQTANSQAKPGILGYLDPHTGAFRPVPAAADEATEAPAATTVMGTVTVTLTITLKTTGLTNISCQETVTVTDTSSSGASILEETNFVAATGTGTTRTCKLSIPYSWSLNAASTDIMSTGYEVFGNMLPTLPQRTSSHLQFDNRKVPANGAITALTANVTL